MWEDHHVTGSNILIMQRRDSYIIMVVIFTLGGDDFTLQELEEIPREVGGEWEQQGNNKNLHISDHLLRRSNAEMRRYRCIHFSAFGCNIKEERTLVEERY